MRRLLVVALGALAVAVPAKAQEIVPAIDFEQRSEQGESVGLLVAGRGTETSRAEALELLGDQRPPVDVTLPMGGPQPNDRRYAIAAPGGGILYSSATRIPGLVFIGQLEDLESREGSAADLRELDRTLTEQGQSRNGSLAILAGLVVLGSVLALLFGSWWVARAALLVGPLCVAASIGISAFGNARPALALPLLAFGAVAVAATLGAWHRVGSVCFALAVAFLVVLVVEPPWPALASIGPAPAEGGRFYGTTNVTATVLLGAAVLAVRELGPRFLAPIALVTLLVVGWSRAGADGGGTVTVLAAFAVYAILLARGRLSPRALAIGAAATVAIAIAVVALDAATGGSSHVTRKLGEGPGAVFAELGDRLELSAGRLVEHWFSPLVFAAGIAALAMLATRRPRYDAPTAFLAGVVVSLLVNDTPAAVAAGGAVTYGVLWTWERVCSRADTSRFSDRGDRRDALRGRGLRRRDGLARS